MQYILNTDKPQGCFLCKAAACDDDRASLVVLRLEHCFCLLNRYPYNNGHLLIAPYAHKGDLPELDDAEQLEMMHALQEMEARLRRVMNPDGFNVGLNLGKVSGAGLPGHIHIHVVPRWNGDTNFMPVLADTKVIPQSLDEVFDLLAAPQK